MLTRGVAGNKKYIAYAAMRSGTIPTVIGTSARPATLAIINIDEHDSPIHFQDAFDRVTVCIFLNFISWLRLVSAVTMAIRDDLFTRRVTVSTFDTV